MVDKVWGTLKAFGSFGFCKAHGAAFAVPTYQSAWLKAHHPEAFLAGLWEHDPGMYPKRLLVAEARRWASPSCRWTSTGARPNTGWNGWRTARTGASWASG